MILQWVKRFFYGRYGVDRLSAALMVTGLVSALAAGLLRLPAVYILYYGCVLVVLARALSRNIYSRNRENVAFMRAFGRVKGFFGLRWKMLRERGTHRYLRCPQCRQRLRVPRGRGKIEISCSRCSHKFIKKV